MIELSLFVSFLLLEVKKKKKKPNSSPEGTPTKQDTSRLPLILYLPQLDRTATSSQKGSQESKYLAFSASPGEMDKEKSSEGEKASYHQCTDENVRDYVPPRGHTKYLNFGGRGWGTVVW